MADVKRWSQMVRTPGSVEVQYHQTTEVAPIGTDIGPLEGRPGTKLYARTLGDNPETVQIDVTSSAVRAMLEGFLHSGRHVGRALSWRSAGFGKLRRDTLHIRPLEPGE